MSKSHMQEKKTYIKDHVVDYIKRRTYNDNFKEKGLTQKSEIPFLTHFSLAFSDYSKAKFSDENSESAELEAENLFNNKYLGHKNKMWRDQSFVENFVDCIKFLAEKSKKRKFYLLYDMTNIILDRENFSYMSILSPLYGFLAVSVPAAITMLPAFPLWIVIVPIVSAKLIYNSYNSSKTILAKAQSHSKDKYMRNLRLEEDLIIEKANKNNGVETNIDKLINLIAEEKNILFNLKKMLNGSDKEPVLDEILASEIKKLIEEVRSNLSELSGKDQKTEGKDIVSDISKAFIEKINTIANVQTETLKSKDFSEEEKKPMTSEKAQKFLEKLAQGLKEVKKSIEEEKAKTKDIVSPLVGQESEKKTDKSPVKEESKNKEKSDKNSKKRASEAKIRGNFKAVKTPITSVSGKPVIFDRSKNGRNQGK